ncbi:hypothetical protein N7539_007044 [Penicillium diatomitis]|uniref:Uncharacterized protein n=1 Tax=Penicillium diatomitis TaxID=2819901 RepID=A0A9W9X2P4_9EURO|nr:uncharacterized protein N7539_007044 [Penicillium diatomitis]KAJ5481150.1 hypothetical protein N7539_007044 [Penicillium diatomitis]
MYAHLIRGSDVKVIMGGGRKVQDVRRFTPQDTCHEIVPFTVNPWGDVRPMMEGMHGNNQRGSRGFPFAAEECGELHDGAAVGSRWDAEALWEKTSHLRSVIGSATDDYCLHRPKRFSVRTEAALAGFKMHCNGNGSTENRSPGRGTETFLPIRVNVDSCSEKSVTFLLERHRDVEVPMMIADVAEYALTVERLGHRGGLGPPG